MGTLGVLRCHLTFALESLTFYTITIFRTFCHLSVICVVYSDLKIVSQQKNGSNLWTFSCDDYNCRRRLSRQKCIDKLISTFGDEAPSHATVKRWYNEFNRGRHSLTNEFRQDRPKSVVGPENINAVQKLIMQDRFLWKFLKQHFWRVFLKKI